MIEKVNNMVIILHMVRLSQDELNQKVIMDLAGKAIGFKPF